MGHGFWIAEHRRHELLWVTICLRVIHHQSQGLAMPRLEGRDKIMNVGLPICTEGSMMILCHLRCHNLKANIVDQSSKNIENHWFNISEIVVVSHQLETLVIVTSPSTGLCRYLLGKYEDSLWREESPQGVCCNLWKISRVRSKQILGESQRYSYDVWSGKCLICNLEEDSPWPRLSKTLCQGWGEPNHSRHLFHHPK